MRYIAKVIMIFLCAGYGAASYAAAYADSPMEIAGADGVNILDYSNMVIPQQGVDCGLHGLKNSIVLFNFLTGLINEQERDEQLQSESIGTIPTMAACRTRLGGVQGTLDPEAVYQVAEGLTEPFNAAYRNHKLLVLDNLTRPELQRSSDQIKQLATLKEEMDNGVPFVHAFVLGNMDEAGQRVGHWISAVLERREFAGPLILHMSNSSGPQGKDFDVRMGTQLMQLLGDLDVKELKYQNVRVFTDLLEFHMADALNDAAVLDVHDVINEAVLQNILHDADFVTAYKPRLIYALNNIDNELLTNEHRKIKKDLLEFLTGPYSVVQWNRLNESRPTSAPGLQSGLPRCNIESAADRAAENLRAAQGMQTAQYLAREEAERQRDAALAAREMEWRREKEEQRKRQSQQGGASSSYSRSRSPEEIERERDAALAAREMAWRREREEERKRRG